MAYDRELAERVEQVVSELRILGEAIAGNYDHLDGGTVQDALDSIAAFLDENMDCELSDGRIFYHVNISEACGNGFCEDVKWKCPICEIKRGE